MAAGREHDETERASLLLEAGAVLDGAGDAEAAVQGLAELLAARAGALAVVGLREPGGPRIAAWAAADEPRRRALGVLVRTPAWGAEGGLAQVMRTGEPLLLDPVDEAFLRTQVPPETDPALLAPFAGHGFAIAPVTARGEVLGAVAVGRRGALARADLRIVEDVGRRAGLALSALARLAAERRLRGEAEAARASLEALVDAAPIGIAFFDTDLRYRQLNARLEELNGLEEAAHVGRRPSDVLPAGGREVEAALEQVLRTGEPFNEELTVQLPGTPGEPRTFVVGLYRVALPGGEPLGVGGTVFEVTERNRANAALQDQRDRYARLLEALDSLGEGVFVLRGGAIEWANSAAAAVAGRTLEELQALPSVMDLIAREDRADVLARMADVLTRGRAVRFDARLVRPDGRRVWVELAGRALLAEGEARIIGVGRDIDERKQAELERERSHRRATFHADLARLLEASLDLRVVLEGTARMLVARGLCDACALEVAERPGWRRVAAVPERCDLDEASALVLPLVSAGEEVGRLLAEGPRDERLLGEVAARVAPVAVNARLYEERARVARVLQESLLPPRLPTVPGVRLATRYVPGAARLDVGGDFYDVFEGTGGVWNAVVGDVCGKGAEAAAMTALARHTLRALARTGTDPADLLTALNATLLREAAREERFVTMVLTRLVPRPDGLRLDVACAGHPPPLVARAAGVEEVASTGPLLGVRERPVYATTHVDLAPGDVAVLYTDGLSEAARAATGRGFVDVPARLRAEGPEAIAAGLEAWARERRGDGEPADDLALLVIGT